MNNITTLHTPTVLPWERIDTVIFKDEQVIARFDNDDFDTPTNVANAAYVSKCVDENEALHKRIAELEAGLQEARDYLDGEPEYHQSGMGCGLEDRNITDRYQAMEHGWEQAMERVYGEHLKHAIEAIDTALTKAGEA